jgi:hypothetical protein
LQLKKRSHLQNEKRRSPEEFMIEKLLLNLPSLDSYCNLTPISLEESLLFILNPLLVSQGQKFLSQTLASNSLRKERKFEGKNKTLLPIDL